MKNMEWSYNACLQFPAKTEKHHENLSRQCLQIKILTRDLQNKPTLLSLMRSRDNAVGIATGNGLNNRGVGVRVLAVQDFYILHVIQTDSGAHQASYSMDTEGSFPGTKAAGVWSWPLTSN
jgi:hypothetical protein